jgi:hypothetical protein
MELTRSDETDLCLQVISVKDGMPTWICEICVTAPTTEEAIEYVKGVEQKLKLDIE